MRPAAAAASSSMLHAASGSRRRRRRRRTSQPCQQRPSCRRSREQAEQRRAAPCSAVQRSGSSGSNSNVSSSHQRQRQRCPSSSAGCLRADPCSLMQHRRACFTSAIGHRAHIVPSKSTKGWARVRSAVRQPASGRAARVNVLPATRGLAAERGAGQTQCNTRIECTVH
jgi:hypothetical protein